MWRLPNLHTNTNSYLEMDIKINELIKEIQKFLINFERFPLINELKTKDFELLVVIRPER